MKKEYIIGIILLILIIFLIFKRNEKLTPTEAILNVASLYADPSGTVSFNNLNTGNIFATGSASITRSSDVGPDLRLINPSKTGTGQKDTYKLWNMTGPNYGDSFQIWKYGTGSYPQSAFVIKDNGEVNIPSGEFNVTRQSDAGPEIRLTNPGKTQTGQKNIYKLWNMTGIYGDSFQIWKYDASGGSPESAFMIRDNGEVNIPSGEFNVTRQSDAGPEIRLTNPGKTANGQKNTYKLWNMTGPYTDSFQIWKYGPGEEPKPAFVIKDGGDIQIPGGGGILSSNGKYRLVIGDDGTLKLINTENNTVAKNL